MKKSIKKNKWLINIDRVEFLAAGEYNENYIVFSGTSKYVFRINHGSQLALKNQIEYEFNVLKAIQSSGVTPVPYFYLAEDDVFNTGILLMEYCEGTEFQYPYHKNMAAHIFARIHALPISETLIRQENPIMDIARESYSLLMRYKDHPLVEKRNRLMDYYHEISGLGNRYSGIFENESLCIVNTEVNSGNFIVSTDRTCLVDWEKAVISSRYQDLGHFLVPTTTLWKSDYMYSDMEKKEFLEYYKECSSLDISLDELVEKTRIMEKVILLRALSWCFMAYYEYTVLQRSLKNEDTFHKIKSYLEDIDWFLQ
ncbi:MAG: aminoglycoside phosphotransferase family protein [Spirochaetales bacterium]|nr:aminoglycoside phosphotransferase family protein [Spirochaetales bacterium]